MAQVFLNLLVTFFLCIPQSMGSNLHLGPPKKYDNHENEIYYAINQLNHKFCPTPADRPWIVEVCRERIIYKKKSVDYCKEIIGEGSSSFPRCVGIVAKATKNRRLCRQFYHPRDKKKLIKHSTCISYYAHYYVGDVMDLIDVELRKQKNTYNTVHPIRLKSSKKKN